MNVKYHWNNNVNQDRKEFDILPLKVLNSLKDNKLYRNINIVSINKKNSTDIQKHDCILLMGNNVENSIVIINSEIMVKNYYKNIYINRIITSSNKNTKKYEKKLSEYYKNINSKLTRPLLFKRNIGEYSKKNLYAEMSNMMEYYYDTLKLKGSASISKYLSQMVKCITSVSGTYKNLLLIFPITMTNIEDIKKFSNVSKLNKNTSQYMYFILKDKMDLLFELLEVNKVNPNNITLMFLNPKSHIFFKLKLEERKEDVDNSTKFKKSSELVKRLMRTCNVEKDKEIEKEIMESETDDEVDSINQKRNKKEINSARQEFIINKSDEVINSFKQAIKLKDNASSYQLELLDKLSDKVLEIMQDVDENEDDKSILNKLDNNEDFKLYLQKLKDSETLGQTDKELKKIEELLTIQNREIAKNSSIKDILKSNEDISIETEKLPTDNLVFDNAKENKIQAFDDSYMEKMYESDLLNVLKGFNEDQDIPLFIQSLQKEDTSDDLTKKETYIVKFKDSRNVTHNVKIDIPKIIDGKYVYINGSKKLIQKQLMMKPIVKTKPDTVQITTNYNKLFIKRFGQKLSENIEVLKKFIISSDFESKLKDESKLKIKFGDISKANQKYPVNLYYSNLSEFLLKIETDEYIIHFDYDLLNSMISKTGSVDYDSKLASYEYNTNQYHIIGYTKKKDAIFLVDKDTNKVMILKDNGVFINKESRNIIYFIVEILRQEVQSEYFDKELNKLSRPKSLIYNRVNINNKTIPLIVILGYEYGIVKILNQYKVDYVFSSANKKPSITNENTMKIRFKDGYLYYNNDKVRNSLLLSGFSVINTEEFEFTEFEKTGTGYVEWFQSAFGSRNTGKGLHNTLSLLIDPKTKDILSRLKLPTNILDLLLYANTLLENNRYSKSNDMSNYRIRGAEQVNGLLYKILADSFRSYKDTAKNGNPVKVSVPQDILLKKLVELTSVDEASDLNPTLELERASSVTYRGHSGLNSADAVTNEMRSYSQSMKGILGAESPDNNKIGVVRFLSYNPGIVNTLGFLDTDDTKNIDNATNMYSIGELLSPFTSKHADPPRLGMQVQQQRQILTIAEPDRPLFGSGIERTIPYLLSDTFVFKAKNDGKIEKIDSSTETALIRYKDGTTDIIDMSSKLCKNSNGGFYLQSKLELTIKEGQSFKKNEILARDKMYMTGNDKDDIVYSMGRNSFIAMASSDLTYEDSSFISSDLTNKMMSKMVENVSLTFAPNTNIDFIVKKDDNIQTGQPLVIFENAFEDSDINEILAKLGTEFEQTVNALSKNTIRSKHTGKIIDIRIYYNLDIEEYSDSLQKIIKTYINKVTKVRNVIDKNAKDGTVSTINLPSINKIECNKIKGKSIQGILIEFYIEHEDYLGVGRLILLPTINRVKSVKNL